jgi:outer membrane protein assembly factor BamB
LYASRRSRLRPAIIVFILVSFILAACGARGTNTNWPGLSTDGSNVYLAYGPQVLAFDVESQQQKWVYPTEPGSNLLFFAAPSVQDGRVILGDYGATSGPFSPQLRVTLYALNGAGPGMPTELWKNSSLATGSIVAPPLQVGDQVFIGTGNNSVLAVDANSGELLWPAPFETEHSIWGKPAYRDGVLYVVSLDSTVYAIEASSGQEQWRRKMDGALASAPVMNEDMLYVASFDQQLHALDIGTGEELWAAAAEDWIWSSPAYDQGVVYYADAKGKVYAVDGETGRPIWDHELGKLVQTSPVVFDEMVYVGSAGDAESGDGLLTALSAADGQELWRTTTPAPIYTTPVIVDSSIVVAPQGEADSAVLMAFNLETGNRQWEVPRPG